MDDHNEPSQTRIRLRRSIGEINRESWQSLAGAQGFTSYDWLAQLEESHDVASDAGWQPFHATLADAKCRLCAVAPSYLKSHSWGEFVFDWSWQSAWTRAGGRYYPKLVTCVPFTPVVGPRLLATDSKARSNLVLDTKEQVARLGLSGWHLLYCDQETNAAMQGMGFTARSSIVFCWRNSGYADFEEYLSVLRASKRKMIRRERNYVRGQGLEFRVLTGKECTPHILRKFYQCYATTYAMRGNPPYFSLPTMLAISKIFGSNLVLATAWYEQELIAGAMFVRSQDRLCGRYWGCIRDVAHLHFEMCYYQGIEYAISQGISEFDPGIQGQHKPARGFVPEIATSWHYMSHPGFHNAVAEFCEQEREERQAECDYLRSLLPFKSGGFAP